MKTTDKNGNLTIEHQFIIPNDIYLPVVFAYEPQNRHLLVINRNHLKMPALFLRPELARDTSGLLNFIGTLNLLNNMDQNSVHINNLPNLCETAINENLDEWLRWFYCLVDTGALLNQARILVKIEHPETYYYDYSL
jgi:hypothetical protein